MRVLLNTIALEPHRWSKDKAPRYHLVRDLLPRIARAGFTQVELWQYHLSTLSPAEVDETAALARKLGLTFPVLGAYPLFHLEGDEAEAEAKALDGLLDRAAALDVRWVKFFFGRVKGSAITPEQLERTTERAAAWIDRGHGFGLDFCAELHGGTLFDPYDFGRRYLAEHPEFGVKICFQPYDFTRTEPALELIEELGPRIVHAHFQGRGADGKAFCRLEDAAVDYTKLIPALAEANPRILPSIEFVPNGFPADGQELDFDAALADAVADARFIERQGLGVSGQG